MHVLFFRFFCCVSIWAALPLAATANPRDAGQHRGDSFGSAYPSTLWPKVNGVATVYYVIDPASAPSATPNIAAALATFNADFAGVITWTQWSSSLGPNYVDINLQASDTSGQCEALEGDQHIPAQHMWGSASCTVGTILHEMGHVIGLWHEQARPDRDTYVNVNYGNVIKGSWSNFARPADNFELLGLYDYASVMQYAPFTFTRNGGPVIESIPPGIPLGGGSGLPYPLAPDYSAGDKEAVLRLYGAAPTGVTVTSNPIGLTVMVDGSPVTTPEVFAWPLNSTHTLSVPAGVQTLSGNIAGSSTHATFYYTYGRWNDSKQQSHSVTVTPGNGDPAFPRSAPQVATYAANFVQLVPYHGSVFPSKAGKVSVAPAPKTYAGASGKFFVARQPITLTATPSTAPWAFYEFNNAPYWLPGGLGLNPKALYVPDTGNPVNTTAEFSNVPVYAVQLSPDYPTSNLYATIDGQFWYTPKNFSPRYDSGWTAGTQHTLDFTSPEYPYSANTRFAFVNWNGPAQRLALPVPRARGVGLRNPVSTARGMLRARGGATIDVPQTITLPAASATYVGTLSPQYAPATNFGYPPCGGGGTISPASPTGDGFYPAGEQLQFSAAAAAGWTFAGWSYDLTGYTDPATLTANDETLVFANFNITATPLSLTSLVPASAPAGSPGFTLRINGTGFSTGSLVAFNGTYRAVQFVSGTQLKVALTAADIAAGGAYQVFVENFPTGSNGCAVFGYAPFFVSN